MNIDNYGMRMLTLGVCTVTYSSPPLICKAWTFCLSCLDILLQTLNLLVKVNFFGCFVGGCFSTSSTISTVWGYFWPGKSGYWKSGKRCFFRFFSFIRFTLEGGLILCCIGLGGYFCAITCVTMWTNWSS